LELYTELIDSKKLFLPNRNHFDKNDATDEFYLIFEELEELVKKIAKQKS